ALHLSLVALPVLYSRGVARDVLVLSLGGGVLLALAVESARRASPHIGAGFERAFGTLLRERERAAVTGATWLLAACFAAVLALPREAAVAALWCAAAGDPAATLVGRATAALRGAAAPLTKTPAGSAACFITSLAGTWALAPFPLTAAALIALLATLVERLPLSLDDNLRVPAAAGVTAWLLS
ncbi:MAG TPA: hypothetical protein VIH11_09910, partial [Gemmatimonadaceae bacterium]